MALPLQLARESVVTGDLCWTLSSMWELAEHAASPQHAAQPLLETPPAQCTMGEGQLLVNGNCLSMIMDATDKTRTWAQAQS